MLRVMCAAHAVAERLEFERRPVRIRADES